MAVRIRQTFFVYVCMILKLRIYSQANEVFDSTNVQINALNINTKESEFGPFKIEDRFYYTSSRERRLGVIHLDEATEHQMLDIYEGRLKDSITVADSRPLRNSVNNSLHQGSSFFDKESARLYYAGNIRADYKGEKYKLAIFSTELVEGRFQTPKIELLLPDTFLASHPMVYNKKLYFSSNLKGGKGKADLYVAEQVNGRWGNIVNLKELNSEDNDYFPFVINEREIYFSSDRPGGLGRLDLYKYTLNGNNEVRIQNLGKPVNSAHDDYSAWIDGNQESGYFTSTRNGGQDDIFYFAKTWPTFNNCLDAIKETYCYDLTDEKALETDSLKGYFYEWDFGDGSKEKGISVTHCYAQPGNYVVNLNIVDVSTKAVFLNQTAIDLFVDSLVQLKINTLDTQLVNKPIAINTLGTYLPGKKITGYYFELDNKRFRKPAFEYTFSKTGTYRIKLGVEYHDLEQKSKGTMCTTLDIHIVDSASWLPFEKRKIDEVITRFEQKNIRGHLSGLSDMNYDAELAYNGNLGLNREKLAEKIDQFLSKEQQNSEAFEYERPTAPTNKNLGVNRSYLNGQDDDLNVDLGTANKGFIGKNLNGVRNLLTELNEEAELTYRVHLGKSKTPMDTTVLNAKGIHGIREEIINGYHVYTYGNEAKPAEIDKYYQKALSAGVAEVEVFGYKNNVIRQEEYAAAQSGFFGRNIHAERNLLNELNEDAELTYRVHLGSSKTKMDTTVLHAKGIHGIKEEFINGRYVYTWGNEARPTEIDKYYRKALAAGLADVEVFGYRHNVIDKEEYLAAQEEKRGFFGPNINGVRNLLSELDEEAGLTYRVHLGKSKTRMDTTLLNEKGIHGIREEKIDGYYVYTWGNEAKPKDINTYYKKALVAGLADVEVYGYKNNQLRKDEYLAAQSGLFGKNIGADRNLLSELSEEANLTYRVHLGKSKTPLDTAVFTAKKLYGVKEEKINGWYVYTYGNETKPKNIDRLYKKALSAGLADVEVYGYKNNQIRKAEYAAAESGFFGKNIGVERHLLDELTEEAGLTYRVHIGRSKFKMDTTVLHAKGLFGIREELIDGEYVYTYGNEAKAKDITKLYKKALSAGLTEVDVFAYKNNVLKQNEYLASKSPDKPFFAPNISASRNRLNELTEENDVTFRVHLGRGRTKMDTTALSARGIHGIREEWIAGEYVYTYGNARKVEEVEKYYNKALEAGVARPEVFAYKKEQIRMEPYLESLRRDKEESSGTGYYASIAALKDTLLHLSEEVEMSFRVYLGKSKTRKDTTRLAAAGISGIREELIDGEYVYTYGNEKKVATIEKFYRSAKKAGISEPVILAYRNNVPLPNQRQLMKDAAFDELPALQEPLASQPAKKENFFQRKRREREEMKQTMAVAVAAAEKAVEPEGLAVQETAKKEVKRDSAPAKKEEDNLTNGTQPDVMAGDGPKPGKKKTGKTPFEEPPADGDSSFAVPDALKPEDVKLRDVAQQKAIANDHLEEFEKKYGDASAKGLEFRVQISAFKYRNRYEFPHLQGLGTIENTLTEGGVTRITIGGAFDTYKKALELNRKVVAAGQKDAFVTMFYEGKRVYPENLEKMGIFLTK